MSASTPPSRPSHSPGRLVSAEITRLYHDDPPQTPTVKHLAKPKSSKKQEEEGEVPKTKQRSARCNIYLVHDLPATLSPCSLIFLISLLMRPGAARGRRRRTPRTAARHHRETDLCFRVPR